MHIILRDTIKDLYIINIFVTLFSDTYYTIIIRKQSLIKHGHVNQAIWLIIIFALKHNQKTQRPPAHFYNRRSTLMTHGLPVAVAFPPVA